MPRPKSITLDEEAPAAQEVAYWKPNPAIVVTSDRFNGEIGHRRYIIIHDPSGDFKPGARFGRDDLWMNNTIRYAQVLSCWSVGLIIQKASTGQKMILKEDRHFHTTNKETLRRASAGCFRGVGCL